MTAEQLREDANRELGEHDDIRTVGLGPAPDDSLIAQLPREG